MVCANVHVSQDLIVLDKSFQVEHYNLMDLLKKRNKIMNFLLSSFNFEIYLPSKYNSSLPGTLWFVHLVFATRDWDTVVKWLWVKLAWHNTGSPWKSLSSTVRLL